MTLSHMLTQFCIIMALVTFAFIWWGNSRNTPLSYWRLPILGVLLMEIGSAMKVVTE